MRLAGDADRERAVAALREHFARGRLTLDELGERIELALGARSREQLRFALGNLPQSSLRPIVEATVRGAALVVLTGAWLLFSFVLLVVFGFALVIQGASLTLLIGSLAAWLIPTYLLSRLWHRTLPRRTAGA
jgi:hypothetical protein